ncbi:hypothetical protein BGZ73_008344, partial [Actinomortierella ambigua]
VVAGAPVSPMALQNNCRDLAKYAQNSSRLPVKPEEDGVVTKISGWTAKKMFPNHADDISIFEKYSFVTYFNKCERSPAYLQVQIKSGPYKEHKTTKNAYDLSLQVGFDVNLATLYKYLPNIAAKASVSRGVESVVSTGVEIKDGELKQECVVSPGWHCTALVRLDEIDSGKIIVNDRIRQPTFFPASLRGSSLFSDVWLSVPNDTK